MDIQHPSGFAPHLVSAVIVDVKDDGAAGFYAREGFQPFPDRPLKLFMHMDTVAHLFG